MKMPVRKLCVVVVALSAAALSGASSLWLWLNLVSAWRIYRRVNALILQSRQEQDANAA